MSPSAFFWHLVNFFAVSVTMGVLAAALARLVWARVPVRLGWRGTAAACVGSAAAAQVAGFLVFGGDGRMATYALMVVSQALVLGWVLGPPR
jgi:hypothetical protein